MLPAPPPPPQQKQLQAVCQKCKWSGSTRPINSETLWAGSAICVLISLILRDSLLQTSQAPSVELGSRGMCKQTLRSFGAVNPGALDSLALPLPSTGQRHKEESAPESGRRLAVQRGPLNVATKPQPLPWALRNRRNHVLLVSRGLSKSFYRS